MKNKLKKSANSRDKTDPFTIQTDSEIREEELAFFVKELTEQTAGETIANILEGIVILWGLGFTIKD